MLGVVVPAMREGETIGPLVQALDKFADVVIVASGDELRDMSTYNAAYRAGANVVHNREGLGPSYRRAWQDVPDDWYVGHIDAGGSHDPADLADMVDIAASGYDCVIGSRFGLGGEHYGKWSRKFTSRMASHAMNLTSKVKIEDWTSGLRVYSPLARKLLTAHAFTTTGHAWQIESLKVLTQAHLKIVECPITYMPSESRLNAQRVGEAARYWWSQVR